MPLYEYKCPACQRGFTRLLKLKDYREPQTCPCGTVAEKRLSAPAVRPDYEGYDCPVTGRRIEGRRAHEENLKRHGCRVLETGEVEDSRARASREDAELDRQVEATADQFISSLPAVKLEKLVSEVAAGASATVVRQ